MKKSEVKIGQKVRFLTWSVRAKMYLWTFGTVTSVPPLRDRIGVMTDESGGRQHEFIDVEFLEENIPTVPEIPENDIPMIIHKAKDAHEFLLWFPGISAKLFMNPDLEEITIRTRSKETSNVVECIYRKND